MQQRRLRLGDIVDDYCPRERRVTNHAIVAMIEDAVKQTRCTTCDAEHEYKHARIPAQRRKKDAVGNGADVSGAAIPRKRSPIETPDEASAEPLEAALEAPDEAPVDPAPDESVGEPPGMAMQASDAAPQTGETPEDAEPPTAEDEGPVHRRLIRATLPRPEGQLPERKLPEFTMHQREANGNRAGRPRRGPRGAHGAQARPQHGNGQPHRFGGQRPGPRHGTGPGGGQQPGQRRRKRRR